MSMEQIKIKEFNDLICAWRDYFWHYFYSKRRLRRIKKTAPRKLPVVALFIFIIIMSVSWLISNKLYAIESLSLAEVNWLANLSGLFPWAVSCSFMSVFVHFLRKKFVTFKRALDFLVASLGLIILSPLFLIISVLIKIDSPGPAFFNKQRRAGKDGKIFQIWKFRTMREDAEVGTGPVWAGEDDPRITKLGRFLRKSHIDEIPQLINVFKGEMSLVGPRPERPEIIKEINSRIPKFDQRLRIKPGITGLAQVRYSYGATFKDAARKLDYDLLYIKKMCWLLDFRIIYWTLGRALTGEGAR